MKKILAVVLLVSLICLPAAYAEGISVNVNGEAVEFDVGPQVIDGKIMIPMRFVLEKIGASVSYDDETETISTYFSFFGRDPFIIIIQIGNEKAFSGSGEYQLETAPVLLSDRTLVPADFFEKALSAAVEWDKEGNNINITIPAGGQE